MAAQFRSQPFMRLQTRLKRERAFVVAERARIQELYQSLDRQCLALFSTAWLAHQGILDMQLFLANKIPWDEWERRAQAQAHGAGLQFVDGFNVLGSQAVLYEEFVTALLEDPRELACCFAMCGTMSEEDLEPVLRTVQFSLFGNYMLPWSEQALLAFLTTLLEQLFKRNVGSVQTLLRTSSLFARGFMLYCKELSMHGHLYLVTSLRNAVLDVLADDDLDLEVEPSLVWSRLSEAQRVRFFGPDHGAIPLTAQRLLANPAFRAFMTRIYDRLRDACAAVLRGLMAALPCMPVVIRRLAVTTKTLLQARGLSAADVLAVLGDLVLVRYVSPAIANPEPFGVVIDTPITSTGRRNLSLVARTLRDFARGRVGSAIEGFMDPLHEHFGDFGVTQVTAFFDALVTLPDTVELLQ